MDNLTNIDHHLLMATVDVVLSGADATAVQLALLRLLRDKAKAADNAEALGVNLK